MTPTLTTGITILGSEALKFVGVSCGRFEYRIYTDRQGWYVGGGYTVDRPRGAVATQIQKAINQGGEAFFHFLEGGLEKWELKERVGI